MNCYNRFFWISLTNMIVYRKLQYQVIPSIFRMMDRFFAAEYPYKKPNYTWKEQIEIELEVFKNSRKTGFSK